MTVGTEATIRRHRLYTRLGALGRDPLGELDRIRDTYGDEMIQLHLGMFKPYLVTNPDQVQHVWRNSRETYLRDGMMWAAMQRLQGTDGIGAEGPGWERSRHLIEPLFTAKAVGALVPGMVEAVNEAVDDLAARTAGGESVELAGEMMRITHRVLGRVFLGEQIPGHEADTVGREIAAAFGSMQARLAMPFVPHRVPLPGDRRFGRAVRTVDAILLPHIARARQRKPQPGVVSMLAHATGPDGRPLEVRQVRNDVVGLFTGGTETTALALTWMFIQLDAHPDIAARIVAEVEAVVGDGPVTAEQVKGLRYTRMVLEESLRLFPPAWMIPRTLRSPDTLGGVRLPAGATVVLSPYLTHRLPELWPDPARFDPERFAPGAQRGRHPYAYFPFAGGVHRCLGQAFFFIEAALAAAAILSRFAVRVATARPIRPAVSVSLRPKGDVAVDLVPRR
ncbi:cytochrome P450 [Micromonospora endolithica]|uniref:Cytochrome P450 n=1 Tax=Micromonospora endolithica TaxID=230091 RepID=A0A3A9ZSQ1_9ACTN|nr:cytochrome P450 [Micromonospora endolithica]RKN50626.1 cytochrome P450 [Micromonospora endolithica]TWJ20648.1 cytochrome P450 [Micromonospora endolithica]